MSNIDKFTPEQVSYLRKMGWELIDADNLSPESPASEFYANHIDTGAQISRDIAKDVVTSLLATMPVEEPFSNIWTTFKVEPVAVNNPVFRLLAIVAQLNFIVKLARNQSKAGDYDAWSKAYDVVFAQSGIIGDIIKDVRLAIGSPVFDWYDPDQDYEDDVMAYVDALNRYIDEELVNIQP